MNETTVALSRCAEEKVKGKLWKVLFNKKKRIKGGAKLHDDFKSKPSIW